MKTLLITLTLFAAPLCAADFEYLGRVVKNPCFLLSEKGDFVVVGIDPTWNRNTKVALPWKSAEPAFQSSYAKTRSEVIAGTKDRPLPIGDFEYRGYTFSNALLWKRDEDRAFLKTNAGILVVLWRDVPMATQEKLGVASPIGRSQAIGAWMAANGITSITGEITQILDGGFLVLEDRSLRIYHVVGKTEKAQGERVGVYGKRRGNFSYVTVLLAESTVPSLIPVALPAELR